MLLLRYCVYTVVFVGAGSIVCGAVKLTLRTVTLKPETLSETLRYYVNINTNAGPDLRGLLGCGHDAVEHGANPAVSGRAHGPGFGDDELDLHGALGRGGADAAGVWPGERPAGPTGGTGGGDDPDGRRDAGGEPDI